MVCVQLGTFDCMTCVRNKFKAVTQVWSPNKHVTYLQTAVWILHKLLLKYQKLRITIKAEKWSTLEKTTSVKLLAYMWNINPYQMRFTCKTKLQRTHGLCSDTAIVWRHAYLSVTSAAACVGFSTCICAFVIRVFWESQGPCFPCGALVLALQGRCRSCHYKWCGQSSESCYLKAQQH